MSRPETDEQYGRDLMRRLAAEPDAPSRVDLSRAVAVGRRRRRNRRIGMAAAAAAVAAVTLAAAPSVFSSLGRGPDRGDVADTTPAPRPSTTTAPTAPTACTADWLPLPGAGSAETTVSAGDPTGRWYAGRYRATDGDGIYRVVMWHDGELVQHSKEMAGVEPTVNDINAAGVVVGQTIDGGFPRPYAYDGRKVVKLPGVAAGEAVAVNDAGTIVGYRTVGNGYPVPVRWESSAQAAVNLPLPPGYDTGEAFGVDEDGTVVGSIGPRDKRRQPYLWRADGTGKLLPLPKIAGRRASEFNPVGIRNGWVVGSVVAAGTATGLPYRYHIGTRQFEQLSTGGVTIVAVNRSGWAVGYGGVDPTEAVYLAGPREVPLVSTVLGSYRGSTHAVTISDDGRSVAGDGLTEENESRPMLWRCG